jgi:hypothetical protein
VKRHPEGVERMWAIVRWDPRRRRLRIRRGLPPGLLVLACRLGLHFMYERYDLDGYACRCRREHLWYEEIRHP